LNDLSNGYEAIADQFIALRSDTGRSVIENWAASFAKGASVLDVGAGSGVPLTRILIKAGLNVRAIDASPTMVKAFRANFPDIDMACEAAEMSPFFNQKYDGVLMVGLLFLLPEKTQPLILKRLANVLRPNGRLLFSAPEEIGEWDDLLTGRRSYSLGQVVYQGLLSEAGLTVLKGHTDRGGSHYYEAQRLG